MKNLKIFYTISFFIPQTELNLYAVYFDYAQVAKARNIPFEMISFQDEPGRFLTDPVIFSLLENSDDSIFPVTVLNNQVVKTSSLPTDTEFAKWFESLHKISYKELLEGYFKLEKHSTPQKHDLYEFCSPGNCATCSVTGCGMTNVPFQDVTTFDDVDSWADI